MDHQAQYLAFAFALRTSHPQPRGGRLTKRTKSMKKAAILFLAPTLVLAASPAGFAQAPAGSATNEVQAVTIKPSSAR